MNNKTFAIVTAVLAAVLAVSAVIVFTSRTSHGNNESFIDCESTVFTSDDIQPEFLGGRKAYLEYIRRNMNYPADALRNGVEGGVLVKFIVEKDGSISKAEILRSMTESFDTEALRLICHMPNWTPGVWKGKTRRMQVIRLVDFRIEENDGLDIEADKADVQESSATTAFTQDKLKPGTIISGIVSDASTGEPIGNALIIETVENDTAAYYYTSTDRDGHFSYPLYGTGHVLKVIANRREYKMVKIPLENKTTFEIKLEKDPDGDGGDGVMYSIGPFDIREGWEKSRSGSNISVVKPGSLRDDGEGILIEEID